MKPLTFRDMQILELYVQFCVKSRKGIPEICFSKQIDQNK